MSQYVPYVLKQRSFLLLLFLINLGGTVYGYIWYGPQLERTPAQFYIFVPDSPTASLFFTIVLFAYLLKQQWGLIEALAITSLVKYGLWAVVMNLLTLAVEGELHWTGYMLIASHLGMAIQGVLYAPFYRIKLWHFFVAAVWLYNNEIIDYVFLMYPRYSSLTDYALQIGYFTFWLSTATLMLTYYLTLRKKKMTWDMDS
nr:DUF1405 domain-containing protein [Bacillus fonticola]